MEFQDYYETLGISKNASDKEIKVAYRRLARQYHPDVNPDDTQAETRFKQINEAYEVLGDPKKRASYDQLGANWHRWQKSGQPGGFDWASWANTDGQPVDVHVADNFEDMFGGGGSFSDFFSGIFGGGSTGARRTRSYQYQSRPQTGQDIEQDVEISLAEAYRGTTRLLRLEKGRRLEVKIPAGAKTGVKVRVRGEGRPGLGNGQTGDLYLKVTVADDARFERQEDDLYTTVPGDVKLKIPAGSQNGQSFRLRGKGMPNLRHKNSPGDLYAKLDVRLPTNLSARQQELFEQLRGLDE